MCQSIKSVFLPDLKEREAPIADPEKQREEARKRARMAQQRSRSGFGVSATQRTGSGGIPTTAGKGAKTLLGQ